VRRLRTCGDSLLTLEGVFSGSLSWVFNQYDGNQPFSVLLREARRLGDTEPDPRSDLSVEDVARKLLIIARNAAFSLGTDEVDVQGLVPKALRAPVWHRQPLRAYHYPAQHPAFGDPGAGRGTGGDRAGALSLAVAEPHRRMRAIAERLVLRCAAAAQSHAITHFVFKAIGADQLHAAA